MSKKTENQKVTSTTDQANEAKDAERSQKKEADFDFVDHIIAVGASVLGEELTKKIYNYMQDKDQDPDENATDEDSECDEDEETESCEDENDDSDFHEIEGDVDNFDRIAWFIANSARKLANELRESVKKGAASENEAKEHHYDSTDIGDSEDEEESCADCDCDKEDDSGAFWDDLEFSDFIPMEIRLDIKNLLTTHAVPLVLCASQYDDANDANIPGIYAFLCDDGFTDVDELPVNLIESRMLDVKNILEDSITIAGKDIMPVLYLSPSAARMLTDLIIAERVHGKSPLRDILLELEVIE